MEIKGDKKVIIYTLINCIYCNWLKGKLSDLNINYREYIIDDGDEYNIILGNSLERKYQTENYPIVEIVDQFKNKISFISKTDLEEQENIRIYTEINELIKIIKNEI